MERSSAVVSTHLWCKRSWVREEKCSGFKHAPLASLARMMLAQCTVLRIATLTDGGEGGPLRNLTIPHLREKMFLEVHSDKTAAIGNKYKLS